MSVANGMIALPNQCGTIRLFEARTLKEHIQNNTVQDNITMYKLYKNLYNTNFRNMFKSQYMTSNRLQLTANREVQPLLQRVSSQKIICFIID